MAARHLVCLVLVGAVLVPVRSPRCEVIHGFQSLRPVYLIGFPEPMPWDDGFDFLTQTVVPFTSDAADICYQNDIRGDGSIFWTASGDGLIWLGTDLESVSVAPAITGNTFTQAVVLGRTYVTRTGDGLYAKFAVREFDEWCCGLVIEYYVQMDGSPSFVPALPVESASWGRVKALYR